MNPLTAREVFLLNDLNRDTVIVGLGTKIQAIITDINAKKNLAAGTPVNAVNATSTLTLTGVVVHHEYIKIGDDTYEFVADALQTTTRPEFILVDIEANTTKSTNNLTVAVQPTAGDTMTIDGKLYTFVPVGTANADGEISVGADLAEAKVNIVAAINGTDGFNTPNPGVSAGEFAANVSAITALVGGVAGDSIGTTETFANAGNVFSAAVLAGGADCTAANAITALVAAVTASDTQGVGAADGAGDTVVLTADVAGVAANAIDLDAGLANATFTGGLTLTTLLGGVDGTVGDANTLLFDATYLYLCITANTITGKNWRRVSLGAAF